MIPNITPYDTVPGFIEPTPLCIDIAKLNIAVSEIFAHVKFDKYSALSAPSKNVNFNLNYPSKIPAEYITVESKKYVGDLSLGEEELMKRFNISTADFDTMPELVKNSYIGTVASQLTEWHNANRPELGQINRIHCIVLSNGSGHRLHVDPHTTCRYHIALTTNIYSYMMAVDEGQVKTVHIPADGRIWLLDTNHDHAAQNIAPHNIGRDNRLRIHMVFSVSK
jgi:hypothetical protein